MILFFLCIILLYLVVERMRHEQRLSKIPLRIHVNGTRGKSSVVRLIAAALRRSGIRTLAKTTGTAPRLILPDGRQETLRRLGPANILEQLQVVKRAERLGAQAIVIECMALDPMLQFVSEMSMIRATVGVVTNVRPDHFEIMGNNLAEVAEALCATVPRGGLLLTAELAYFKLFSQAAAQRGSRAVYTGGKLLSEKDADPQPDPGFFRENIEIAETLCAELGLDPGVVWLCLKEADIREEGAGRYLLTQGNRVVHFIDAFSANDVESTRIIQKRAMAGLPLPRPWVALFNNRADRPLRMKSFVEDLLTTGCYDYVALMGEGLSLPGRALRGRMAPEKLIFLTEKSPEALLRNLIARIEVSECTLWGMGNEKGWGASFSNYIKERSGR